MKRGKRFGQILSAVIVVTLVFARMVTPVFALTYDTNNPAPPIQFRTPALGQTVLVCNNDKPLIEFTAPYDSGFASFANYWSHFEIQYMTNSTGTWKYCTNVWVFSSTGSYSTGDMYTYYQPYGELVRFRVRTVSKTNAVSAWIYSGYFMRNTPIASPPKLSISPNPTVVGNCYEDSIRLSWQPCPADVDGQIVTYQVELGEWDGAQYVYLPIAETPNLSILCRLDMDLRG